MNTHKVLGALEVPSNRDRNETIPEFTARCTRMVKAHPAPGGMRYLSHVVSYRDGKSVADVEYTFGSENSMNPTPELLATVQPPGSAVELDSQHASPEVDKEMTADLQSILERPKMDEIMASLDTTALMAHIVAEREKAIPQIDHKERKHHEFGMSRLPMLDKCRKFRSQQGGTNTAAEEGTANHELVEGIIGAWLEERQEQPNLTLVQTLAMADIALEPGQYKAIQEVLMLVDGYWPDAVEMLVEERITIFHPDGSEFIFGTSDLIFLYADKSAVLIDYKFGMGLVTPAQTNKQGWGYALGLFQQDFDGWGSPERIKVIFVQPRVNYTTEAWFSRENIPEMYATITNLVDQAKEPDTIRNPGDQCRYCAERGTCSALATLTARAHAQMFQLEMPKSFDPGMITTPEEMSRAFWFAKRIEPFVEAVKKAALEMAKEGFELRIDEPGFETSWEIGEKNASRELGESPLVYQEVKDVLDAEQYSAATEVKLGALETIFADTLVEKTKATGGKMTKKAAKEELSRRLSAAGLVTRSEVKIQYLKEVKAVPAIEV